MMKKTSTFLLFFGGIFFGVTGSFFLGKQSLALLSLYLVLLVAFGWAIIQEIYKEQKEEAEEQKKLVFELIHELRNPLASLRGFLQLIFNQKKVEFPPVYFTTVFSEIDRMSHLLEDFTWFEDSLGPERFRWVDLDSMLGEIVILEKGRATTKGVILAEDLKGIGQVFGNPDHLRQLWMNLIRNAIEASEPETEVKVSGRRERNMVYIEITDHGAGMSQEILDKIGDPFFTTKKDGTGLGVSVCMQVVREHKGKIHFQSVVGAGTVVKIQLPVFKRVKSALPL